MRRAVMIFKQKRWTNKPKKSDKMNINIQKSMG